MLLAHISPRHFSTLSSNVPHCISTDFLLGFVTRHYHDNWAHRISLLLTRELTISSTIARLSFLQVSPRYLFVGTSSVVLFWLTIFQTWIRFVPVYFPIGCGYNHYENLYNHTKPTLRHSTPALHMTPHDLFNRTLKHANRWIWLLILSNDVFYF